MRLRLIIKLKECADYKADHCLRPRKEGVADKTYRFDSEDRCRVVESQKFCGKNEINQAAVALKDDRFVLLGGPEE